MVRLGHGGSGGDDKLRPEYVLNSDSDSGRLSNIVQVSSRE